MFFKFFCTKNREAFVCSLAINLNNKSILGAWKCKLEKNQVDFHLGASLWEEVLANFVIVTVIIAHQPCICLIRNAVNTVILQSKNAGFCCNIF